MVWQSPKKFSPLDGNQVHIWRASLIGTKEEVAEFAKSLNQEERARAAKFVVAGLEDRFIMARGILRKLLAKYLQTDPQDFVFQQNRYGKLHLDFSRLQFNLSHSHNLGLFIFTLDKPVGVDVEFIRNGYEFKDIAQKFFSEGEIAELFALPSWQQERAFFNCWSRKEAFIKALGVGLFCSLDSFSVEVSDSRWGKLRLSYVDDVVIAKNGDDVDVDVGSWSLEAFDPANEYAGAFVVGGSDYIADFYDFNF